jgi:TfoX/Sxy family transcriptional regulator of competence genes
VAYDEELADRVRSALNGGHGITEKRMFGGLAFLTGGNMAVVVSGQGGLMLRCDPAATDELVAEAHVSRMVMRGRELDGWIRVTPESLDGDAELDRWVAVGLNYAKTLPPKR